MNCADVNNQLQDYIDGQLPPSDHERMAEHHQSCAACADRLLDALGVIRMLKTVDVVSSTPNFTTRVIDRAVDSAAKRPRRIPLGIAASFALVAIISIVWSLNFSTPADIIKLQGDEIRIIKVAIDSAHQVEDVKMTIGISDNLEISGYKNRKSISWNASLSKGVNVISLPVSALNRGDGEITAELKLDDRVKIFKIKILAEWPDRVRRQVTNVMDA